MDPTGHGGGFVFDCRGLPNPFWEEGLRCFSGKDAPVKEFFARQQDVMTPFTASVLSLVRQSVSAYQADGRSHLIVAFGYTGGQHRSVFMAEELARHLMAEPGVKTEVVHQEEANWKRW